MNATYLPTYSRLLLAPGFFMTYGIKPIKSYLVVCFLTFSKLIQAVKVKIAFTVFWIWLLLSSPTRLFGAAFTP